MQALILRLRLLALSLWSGFFGEVRCLCGWKGKQYIPFLPGRKDLVRCPKCLSVDRQRLYRMFLEEMSPHPEACLHVAPERIIMDFLRERSRSFLTIDLDPQHVMQKEDLTNLTLADASFDFMFCAHVLEHIQDDRSAMKELYRVLAPGGMAIIQVPLTLHPTTYEDPSITDPVARRKAFGQEDHVRKYGRDFYSRLADAGFSVKVFRYFDELPGCIRKVFGLRSEDICLCTKHSAD